MLFSDYFAVTRRRGDDWFDLILDTDTKLFVDPFLIFKDGSPEWSGAHAELVEHFNRCFHLVAQANGNPKAVSYKKALALLEFPEPREFCLGYTDSGTSGLGGGKVYARLIAQAMDAAVERGIGNLRHFEELGILNEGIGPDRISDFTCNILRGRFVAYTRLVINRHRLRKTKEFTMPEFDPVRSAWRPQTYRLPANPFNKKAVLLVPQRFLCQLPTLNADDWWENYEAEQLRNDLNYEILGKVNKQSIVAAARRHPDQVQEWTASREEGSAYPYDLGRDPQGVYQWDSETSNYVRRHPLTIDPPTSQQEFFDVIELVIKEFRRYVEQQRGWSLLWNDGHVKEKPEEAVQLLFMGVARAYCRANNIVVDREVELGRGPVDFKFSNGYQHRALLEIKKLHNGKFWNGLEFQLPSYQDSDDCPNAWFVAVEYFSGGVSKKRKPDLAPMLARTATRTGRRLRLSLIDARPKESASKLKQPHSEESDTSE